MPEYGGAEGSALGGNGRISVAPANGSKGLYGAPGKGGRGGSPDKVPDSLPPKLLLLLL